MGNWRAIALDSVRHGVVADELASMGVDWSRCAHVPATGSLAKVIRQTGAASLPIATIIDLIVMDALPDGRSMAIDAFPPYAEFIDDGDVAYMEKVKDWQNRIAGRRIWMSIEYQQHLRDYMRRQGYPRSLQRVMLGSLRDYIRTTQTLIAAGIRPELLKPTEQVAKVATDAWTDLERSYPAVSAVRDDLWMDPDEFAAGATEKARSLRSRIYRALERAFGPADGVRTIAYHGYYFFTPPQWAFFQLLRKLPDVDQVFIVHDDGRSPIYESWRWYFVPSWNMPVPERRPSTRETSPGLSALADALGGRKVDVESLRGKVEILRCRTPTEFVRRWTRDASREEGEGRMAPKTFAASAADISRYFERFAGTSQLGTVNLALLPLGTYLFGLHDCISVDARGSVAIELTAETLTGIAASGYLPIHGSQDISALLRALPFFNDCRAGADWIKRAQHLRGLVANQVNELGKRDPSHDDVERMDSAAGNPLRLAPWADLSTAETTQVLRIIESTVSIATELASKERVSLNKHISFIKRLLIRGMSNLPLEVKNEIEGKISGMSAGIDAEISADGLKDVVSLLLGHSADFTLTGEDVESDMQASELRALDALGLAPLDRSLHIANLADGTFPSKNVPIGWPYRIADLETPGAAVADAAVEILRTRSRTAALSDLYLLSLGLSGVSDPHKITLSYIAEVGTDVNNPSPVLTLLTVPGHRPTKAILDRTGGLSIQNADLGLDDTVLWTRRDPLPSNVPAAELDAAAALVHPTIGSSAASCPRRFAIQWATGPSGSYMSEHHHLMLYGNLIGALSSMGKSPEFSHQACGGLWQHFTNGQRTSSEKKAVCGLRGAAPAWLFTLSGAKTKDDPFSQSYRAAIEGRRPAGSQLVPKDSTFLPPAHGHQFDVCKECAVRPRCAVWNKPT